MIPGLARGSVWLAALPHPWGPRPVIILTRDAAIPRLTNVTVVPVTTSVQGIRTEVPIGADEGLPKDSAASCDNVQTMPIKGLRRRIGELGPAKVRELNAAIRVALDL